jgi:hypothetical protein
LIVSVSLNFMKNVNKFEFYQNVDEHWSLSWHLLRISFRRWEYKSSLQIGMPYLIIWIACTDLAQTMYLHPIYSIINHLFNVIFTVQSN